MKELIITYLSDLKNKKRDIHDLMNQFHIKSNEFTSFMKLLNSLEDEKMIVRNQKNEYYLLNQLHYYIGTIRIHKKGYGFVEINEEIEDFYVSKEDMKDAFNGDKVLIRQKKHSNGDRLEASVEEILERACHKVVGEIRIQGKNYFLTPDDSRLDKIYMDPIHLHGAMLGHKVVASILSYVPLKVEVEQILGHRNDPGVDILSVIAKYDVDIEFNKEVYQQIESISHEVLEEDKLDRVDFRNETIVTIDGDDAKDLDDAISLKRKYNGNFELGVHIADVSHYVKEGSALDKEAFQRGTSIYLTDRVIPMLPHKLSNGICSLNEGVDRLTISCIMEIDRHTGDVLEHQIVPGLIRSKRRMTYTNVNKILGGDETLLNEYEDVASLFFLMEELAEILRRSREKRGAIDFNVDEAKVIVDEKGKAKDVVLRTRGISDHIIEEFMLVANETIAEHFYHLDVPFIYRVHERPKVKKLQKFLQVAGPLGYTLKGSLENIYPKDLSRFVESSKDEPEHKIITTLLLRCMQKARYDASCLGHFGLADEYYTHFTSPIRRYPDLIVHRLIRHYLFNQKMDDESLTHYASIVPYQAEHSSNREYEAVSLERDVQSMKMAEYMEDHIGEVFEGQISSMTNFGFFVELENTIDGLVHMSTLIDDYYEFDERTMTLKGQMSGKVYRMSDTVKVKCVGASKIEGTVDFELVGIKKRTVTKKKSFYLSKKEDSHKKVKTSRKNHSKIKRDSSSRKRRR